jgi:Cu+-exporting ATPase
MLKKQIFKLSGMDCTACAMNIDGELEDTPGVKSSNTSYAKSAAEVEFDDAQIDSNKIMDIIKKVGYEASL